MLSKKVSIIIATRNRSESLAKLLDSLTEIGITKDPNLEIVVIDNAPDDSSTQNLCKNYPVVYYRENQEGESFALNKGMNISRGDYVVNTDDDIVVNDKKWLEKLLSNFKENSNLGYVSGNVLAISTDNTIASTWEKKGGLSKGKKSVLYTNKQLFDNYKFSPWPINKIAAGANNMIPRKIFEEVGSYATFLGGGSPIGHANSLEFVYRVIRAGYDVKFDSSATVYHAHPTSQKSLKKKLYVYGIGNSAYQLYLFAKFKDFRCLFWGLIGHHIYVARNLFKSIFGLYSLPVNYTLYSLYGSLSGTIQFFIKYPFRNKKLYP